MLCPRNELTPIRSNSVRENHRKWHAITLTTWPPVAQTVNESFNPDNNIYVIVSRCLVRLGLLDNNTIAPFSHTDILHL